MGSKRSPLGWPRYDLIIYFAFCHALVAVDNLLYVCPIAIFILKKWRNDLAPTMRQDERFV